MLRNWYDIYLWFELRKGYIPKEVKDRIDFYRSNPKKGTQRPIVFETNTSFFLKTPGQSSIDDDLHYYFYNAGWQNLLYRIYLEISLPTQVKLANTDDRGLNQTIEGHQLGLLTIGDACLIQNKKFCLKIDHSISTVTPFTVFVLTRVR